MDCIMRFELRVWILTMQKFHTVTTLSFSHRESKFKDTTMHSTLKAQMHCKPSVWTLNLVSCCQTHGIVQSGHKPGPVRMSGSYPGGERSLHTAGKNGCELQQTTTVYS